jgi:hypothetical protein
MKKVKGSWRPLMAVGLVGVMLALPLSHAAAEQRQQYLPLSPYTPQEEEQEEGQSTAAKWLGVAFVAGLFWCAITDCIGGQKFPSKQEIYRRKDEQASKRTQPGASTLLDNPLCFFGTVKDGTCVR